MANNIPSKDRIDNINNTVEKTLNNSNIKNKKKLEELSSILSDINQKRPSTVNKNILEFYTSIEMNKINKDSKASWFKSNAGNLKKEDLFKQIEDNLKSSMQNMNFEEEKQRYRRYEDYRLIDAYIPELAHCLDVYRDTILSPDDITKESLNIICEDNSEKVQKLFAQQIKQLEENYKLNKQVKEETRNALRDGDLFAIIIPLSKAFSKVLKEDEEVYNEDLDIKKDNDGIILSERYLDFDDNDFLKLLENVEIDGKNEHEIKKNRNIKISQIKKNIIDDINKHVKFYNDPLDLISECKKEENKSNISVNVEGSFFYIPKPENMVKLELDDICLGYLYFDKNSNAAGTYNDGSASTFFSDVAAGGLTMNSSSTMGNDVFNARYDFMKVNGSDNTKYSILSDMFVKGIATKIDKKFIESNKEFKNVIYTLLRNDYISNQDVKITFLEPEYVSHFKLDSNETYGISKYAKSLFFAKLYLSTLITSVFAKIGKGKDKRAFYVETALDDDMEGTINGLMRDIKSKEVTTSTMKNITTILNTVGTYEDYYIPTINGERPFEIDTIPGIQVDINDDFLDFLLKSTIGGTGIPINYIDATRDVDFARTLAMQNSSFVRCIVGYQKDFSDFWTDVVRKLYENEFHNDACKINSTSTGRKKKYNSIIIDSKQIFLNFPTPIYLSLSTMNEQISNISQTVDFIVQSYFGDAQTDENDKTYEYRKLKFRKEIIKRYLSTSIEWDIYDDLYDKIEKEGNKQSIQNKLDELENSDEESNGY